MPSQQEALSIRAEWRIAADERERALRNRHVKAVESYNEHATELPELQEGDYVAIQNGNGSHPRRWDRTGRIMQKLPFRQYRVKVDGSNRVTLRNRKFLRKIDPVCAHSTSPKILSPTLDTTAPQPVAEHLASPQTAAPAPVTLATDPSPQSEPEPATTNPAATATIPRPEGVRTSGRNRQPRELFEASLQGKSHGYKSVH